MRRGGCFSGAKNPACVISWWEIGPAGSLKLAALWDPHGGCGGILGDAIAGKGSTFGKVCLGVIGNASHGGVIGDDGGGLWWRSPRCCPRREDGDRWHGDPVTLEEGDVLDVARTLRQRSLTM